MLPRSRFRYLSAPDAGKARRGVRGRDGPSRRASVSKRLPATKRYGANSLIPPGCTSTDPTAKVLARHRR
jgi:hypothetical protein